MSFISKRAANTLNTLHLRAFVAVCEEGSITQAARKLHVAQPALTTLIRKMEADMGVVLFDRQRRGSTPTEKGRLLLQRSREILGLTEVTMSELVADRQGPEGEVAIGLPPSISTVLAVPLIRHIKAVLPRVSLRVVEAFSGYLWEWLPDNTLDLIICFDRDPTDRVICRPLCTEDIFLVGATSHMRDTPPRVTPDQLMQYPMILPSSKHGIRSKVEWYAALGGSLKVQMQIDAGNQLVKLVAAGEGYSLMARCAVMPELLEGTITAVQLDPPLRRTTIMAINRSKVSAVEVSRVIDETIVVSEDLMANGKWPAQPVIRGDH